MTYRRRRRASCPGKPRRLPRWLPAIAPFVVGGGLLAACSSHVHPSSAESTRSQDTAATTTVPDTSQTPSPTCTTSVLEASAESWIKSREGIAATPVTLSKIGCDGDWAIGWEPPSTQGGQGGAWLFGHLGSAWVTSDAGIAFHYQASQIGMPDSALKLLEAKIGVKYRATDPSFGTGAGSSSTAHASPSTSTTTTVNLHSCNKVTIAAAVYASNTNKRLVSNPITDPQDFFECYAGYAVQWVNPHYNCTDAATCHEVGQQLFLLKDTSSLGWRTTAVEQGGDICDFATGHYAPISVIEQIQYNATSDPRNYFGMAACQLP